MYTFFFRFQDSTAYDSTAALFVPHCDAWQSRLSQPSTTGAHFSCRSVLWWDERGEFALLHKMNAHRVRFIREQLLLNSVLTRVFEPSLVLAGLDVLDVGCGGEILLESSFYHFFFTICTHAG